MLFAFNFKCNSYNDKYNKLVIGSMCDELCKPRNNYETYKSYKLVDCYNPDINKAANHDFNRIYTDYKTVLIFENRGESKKKSESLKKFVLKSRKKYFLDFDTHMDFDFKEKPINEQLEFLIDYIETTLQSKFDLKLDKDDRDWQRIFKTNSRLALDNLDKYANKDDINYYIRLFYLDGYKTYLKALETKDKELLARFITNFVVLTSQDEYLFYKFFQSKPGVLKINATCGNFYMVEFVDTLASKVKHMNIEERKSLAIKFLDLIHSLDTSYLVKKDLIKTDNVLISTPIQFCDVKLDNFGLNQQSQLKIIDPDMAYPDFYIFTSKVCEQHEDCHVFDCKSFCDQISKRCVNKRINNNLQAFCEKIFNNSFYEKDGILSGVDSFGTNVHSEIMNRLSRCQNPGFYQGSDVIVGANDSLNRGLNILLQDTGNHLN